MGMLNDWNWSIVRDKLLKAIYNNEKISGVSGWTVDNDTLQQIRDYVSKYNISESDFNSILNSYKPESFLSSGNVDVPNLVLSDLQEMNSWDEYIGERPEMPVPEDFYEQARADIDKENEELNFLYDSIVGNQREALENSLAENNAMFRDYHNQILTNEAMRQQAIAGSTRYELDRQQRMAISRGASAAQRLVSNINTSLGLQAQSAQQALETSNVLAQNLLNHRQANQNIRSDYLTAQTDDSMRRADLIRGRTERINNAQRNYLSNAMDAYDINNQAYKDRMSSIQGDNPWQSAYMSYRTKKDNQPKAI